MIVQQGGMDTFTLSIVSHGQLSLVVNLLRDLRKIDLKTVTIILTLNIPEDELELREFEDLPLFVIRNTYPKGFAENHNYAFEVSSGDFFCVVNPDIRIESLDWGALLFPFERMEVGALAPLVRSPLGAIEDNVRVFPTPRILFRRLFLSKSSPDYDTNADIPISIDWAAGMFVVFRSAAFGSVSGFDTRFFLYFEDVDICWRLRQAGWDILFLPTVAVVHDARRESRKNARYLRWHLTSALRYFLGI